MFANCVESVVTYFLFYLKTADAPSEIYIGTNGGGIQVYSEATHDERTLVNSTEELEGIAYDWANSALYYSSHTKIYRINPHDTPIQSPTVVFTTTDGKCIGQNKLNLSTFLKKCILLSKQETFVG